MLIELESRVTLIGGLIGKVGKVVMLLKLTDLIP